MNLDQSLQYLTWALYAAIFLAVLVQAARTPTPAHWDMVAFFGAGAAVIVLSTVRVVLGLDLGPWQGNVSAIAAMALPYLLLRLVADFMTVPRWVMRSAEAGLALSVVAVLLAPPVLPAPVTVLLVVYLVAVAVYDTWAFVAHAWRTRGVTRRRMQAVALGSGFLAATFLIAGLAAVFPGAPYLWMPLGRLFGLASGLSYYLGFATPAWLRRLWQAPELQAFLGQVARLTHLPLDDLVAEVERRAAAALGASTAAVGLWQEDKRVLRFYRGAGANAASGDAAPEIAEIIPDTFREHGFAISGPVLDVPPDRLFAGRAFRAQRPFFSADVLRDNPDDAAFYRALDVRAALAAPITTGERRIGVLVVWSSRAPIFAASDLEVVQLLAGQAAVALESHTLLEAAAQARARQEADRLKDEFLASISHDLRNPLAAVHGIAQVLERRLKRQGTVEPERLAAGLANIDAAASQMASLVDQLLDYARIQLHRSLDLDRRPTDLVRVAQRVVGAHEATSERHRILLDVAAPEITGLWDAQRLERVLQNLVVNAVKYSPDGGDVVVRVWQDGTNGAPWAALSVQDQGVGIPAADLPRVFERFHRAANVKGRIAGTGIGLATSRQVVQQHGGTISVESEEGRGSTFTVRLPLQTDGQPPPGEGGGAASDRGVATSRTLPRLDPEGASA